VIENAEKCGKVEVIPAMTVKNIVFWLVTQYFVVDIHRRTLSMFGVEGTRPPEVETLRSSETSVNICHTTWRRIPEESIAQLWRSVQGCGVHSLKTRFLFTILFH
jgi:hypothetical protein